VTGRLTSVSSKPHSQSADLPALVHQAGQILVAAWERVDGPRGPGDKAVIGMKFIAFYVKVA